MSKRSTITGYSVSTISIGVPGVKWFIGSTIDVPSCVLVPPSEVTISSYCTVGLPARPLLYPIAMAPVPKPAGATARAGLSLPSAASTQV